MIATCPSPSLYADPDSASAPVDDAALVLLLEQINVATGTRCTTDESTRFFRSTNSVTNSKRDFAGPSAQDIEYLRQATYKYRQETGEDRATGAALMSVLKRLGYA